MRSLTKIHISYNKIQFFKFRKYGMLSELYSLLV